MGSPGRGKPKRKRKKGSCSIVFGRFLEHGMRRNFFLVFIFGHDDTERKKKKKRLPRKIIVAIRFAYGRVMTSKTPRARNSEKAEEEKVLASVFGISTVASWPV